MHDPVIYPQLKYFNCCHCYGSKCVSGPKEVLNSYDVHTKSRYTYFYGIFVPLGQFLAFNIGIANSGSELCNCLCTLTVVTAIAPSFL